MSLPALSSTPRLDWRPPFVVAEAILLAAEDLARGQERGYIDHMPLFECAPVAPRFRHWGFNAWCSGGERMVMFHESGWCLKVGLRAGYEVANHKELEILSRIGEEDRALFAETYLLPGDILLQGVYHCDYMRYLACESRTRAISKAWERLGLVDLHPYNVGWTDLGDWVFIDWAGRTFPSTTPISRW